MHPLIYRLRALELAMAEWWWIVPVGLVLGAVSYWLTWRSLQRYADRRDRG